MKIENNRNINFKATKLLVAQQKDIINKNKNKVFVEVFRLEKNDISFAQKALIFLSRYKTRELGAFQKRLRQFFIDFLNNNDSQDFYLSVKNNEKFVGAMNSLAFGKENSIINTYTQSPKTFNTHILFYNFLNETQNNYSGYRLDSFSLKEKSNYRDFFVSHDKIDSVKKEICKQNSDFDFIVTDEKNIDLDEYLGTKNFETDIITPQ